MYKTNIKHKILFFLVIVFNFKDAYAHGLEEVVNTFIVNFVSQILTSVVISILIIHVNHVIFKKQIGLKRNVYIGSFLGSIISILIYLIILVFVFFKQTNLSFMFVISISWLIFTLVSIAGGVIGSLIKK